MAPGPFNSLIILTNLISGIALKILSPDSLNQQQDGKNKPWCEKYGLLAFRSIVTITVTLGFSIISSQSSAIDSFLFLALVVSIIHLFVYYYFIKNRPNFHQFAIKFSSGNFDYVFIKNFLSKLRLIEELFFSMLKFLLCFKFNYPIQPTPDTKIELV